ncbi:adenylosuccinate lyase [candidate division TA06 bacterium SM23_40]|uniref:Adenylosuccinate lyase n=2 Tax=Bacteria division TA06 TaxID=1156500 RepID=A0A0S8GAL2_UNCT6|nr:MAG: adenylosuccinate lyase [candidate division TA06 bacterium SM23_40]
MIERYTLPRMGYIWSEENKLATWLEVELLVAEAEAEAGIIPRDAAETMRAKAAFDIDRVKKIEERVRHDVAAFVTDVAETIGPVGRYLHFGLTSSDVLDTAGAVLMRDAGKEIESDLSELLAALEEKARAHRDTLIVGRTHGVHAEPTSLGLKFLLWYDETKRNRQRMAAAVERISYGKISGAVGNFAHLDPGIEESVCARLGLKPAPVSSQVVQRDRHAEYMTTLAIIASTCEKIATEIRNLHRTEIGELEEGFTTGQKGSSSMPHKRNPIVSERIAGLARVVRGNALAALENVALWHERDITHSSVERVIIPDSTILVDYVLHKLVDVIRNLVVRPDRMRKNLELTDGYICSQKILLGLIAKGVSREEAYRLVQGAAFRGREEEKDFRSLVESDSDIGQHLSQEEIAECFRLDGYLKNVGHIYERVLGKHR